MKSAQTPNNLLMLYQVAKKLKSDKGLFKFQLLSDLSGQEMECIIDATNIVQFATMQEISANCIAVYMKPVNLDFSCPIMVSTSC